MASTSPGSARAGWLLVALPAAGAVVLLTVLVLGWVQTRRSATLVARGEAALLVERVAREARRAGPQLTDETLRQLVAGESPAGLVLVAAQTDDGAVVAASSPPPETLPGIAELRPGDVRLDGVRAWARSRDLQGAPVPGGPGGSLPPPVTLVLFFEPRLVEEIALAGVATLASGTLGAVGLVLLGLLALRLLRRNEAALGSLERERRLAALGTMSAVVAHELRNPLAALKGHAQLLVEALEAMPREKAQAQRVVDGAWRLERLSASLLELARTGALSREPASPGALARAAAGPFDASRVRIDDAGAPASWSLDPVRFQQVVTNLVDNALQADPSGPAELRVAAEGGRLVLEVRDHGPGVPEADRERIFEPFVTTRTRGVGLGLAVARQVMALHGGTLSVSDAPGGGALFRAEIPGP